MKINCNVTIKIKSKKKSIKIQKLAYANGYDWRIRTEKYICTDAKYLILYANGLIACAYYKDKSYLKISYKEAIRFLKKQIKKNKEK